MQVKDFQNEREWRWLVNKKSERWHVKEIGNRHKKHKKTNENNLQSNYKYEKQCDEIE